MADKRYQLVYDTEFIRQVKAIERKYYSFIRHTIESQLTYEPDVETRNRKPLVRTPAFGARWELRFGDNNQFRVFYSVYPEKSVVHILAIGVKKGERLYIGGKEVKL
ncbi:MAG TPA: type II toxin-antitoxin system RelE/ParE family toxin [Anaerolineales bacterium]|nr:type II toxin-antitoxin system RelE/ParE family toxin [Anaerolineales bacterium]